MFQLNELSELLIQNQHDSQPANQIMVTQIKLMNNHDLTIKLYLIS